MDNERIDAEITALFNAMPWKLEQIEADETRPALRDAFKQVAEGGVLTLGQSHRAVREFVELGGNDDHGRTLEGIFAISRHLILKASNAAGMLPSTNNRFPF
jgi:hypothetical protein